MDKRAWNRMEIKIMANIYKAINEVMKEIGVVGKNQKNEAQKFMYRGVDAVMNAINPALINHNVFIVPEVLEQKREERLTKGGNTLLYSICRIKFTFYAEDGSYIEAVTVGEGMDSGDKATNKAMAIAFKYACFQVFCIPTEEMAEADAETQVVQSEEQRMMEEAAKEVISAVQVKVLEKKCDDDKIPQDMLCNLYKVKAFSEINQAQFRNINDHWEQIKEKANK